MTASRYSSSESSPRSHASNAFACRDSRASRSSLNCSETVERSLWSQPLVSKTPPISKRTTSKGNIGVSLCLESFTGLQKDQLQEFVAREKNQANAGGVGW